VTARTLCAIPLTLVLSPCSALAEDVVDLAASLIGRPYVWGAEGPRSFDCSGLTQYVFQEFGIQLPRRAISQSRVGNHVGHRLERGDLLFFADDSRHALITHVGIYEGRGRMIEASKRYGRVRRSDLNDPYWAARLMFGRRLSSHGLRERGRDVEDGSEERSPAGRGDQRRVVAGEVLRRIAEALLRPPGR